MSSTSSVRSALGRIGASLFRKPLASPTHAPPSASTAALPTARLVRPIVPRTGRWTTVQISVPPEDAQRQVTDVFSRQYDVSRPLMERFLREGRVQVMRAAKVQVNGDETVPMADPSQVRSWIPRSNLRVQAGDLLSMADVMLTPRKDPVRLSAVKPGSHSEEIVQFIKDLILYQDDRIIIINKPAGIAVHAGPKTRIHIEGYLDALQGDAEIAPLLVHRLDRDTSGALILARTRSVAAQLRDMLDASSAGKTPQIEKVYWAMVRGKPDKRHLSGEYRYL